MRVGQVTEMGPDNPKNYQIWNYRKQCVKRTAQPQRELDFIVTMLDDEGAGDAKNYHAWAYRQWLLVTYPGLWAGELPLTERLLADDILNNSAWNHRFFCVCHSEAERAEGEVAEAVALREVGWAMERLGRVPENEAAWSYALSWCRPMPVGSGATTSDAAMAAARDLCLEGCEGLEAEQPGCVALLGAMGTLLEEEAEAAAGAGDAELQAAAMLAAAEKYARLAELDAIRSGYWAALKSSLEGSAAALG